jgi:hypothetical protein
MFDNLATYGSILSIILMSYTFGVMYVIGGIYLQDNVGHMTPGVVRSSFGSIVIVAAIPTLAWPAIYTALFDGIWSGIIVFLLSNSIAPIIARKLGANGALMGIHFYLATASMIAGYWLSLTNLP